MIALEKHSATAAHWTPQQYENTLAGGRVAFVLEEDSVVHGFLFGRRLDTEWEIENVAVAGPARRRGLGTRLVGEFVKLARSRGAQTVYLEVRESNRAARLLYEKWAFVESGRRKRYYRDPDEDAVLYQLDFS
jgi:[ribosomal protein S18]-alanine N-acetyltransferase